MEGTGIKKLIIIGASGHGKVVADIARLNCYQEIAFLDDNPAVKECEGFPVLGPSGMLNELDGDVFVAIGNCDIRKRVMERSPLRSYPVLIHPGAIVASDVRIGCGSVVMAGAVINPGTKIGKGCIVNTMASVDHDCIVEDYSHIAVGAHLCGNVNIGHNTWIGAGATIINNKCVCCDSIVGAGAVVVKTINDPGTYVGVPAVRKI